MIPKALTFIVAVVGSFLQGQVAVKPDPLDDIREAIIRFEVDAPTNKPAQLDVRYRDSIVRPQRDEMHEVYFVSIGERVQVDPSDDLLARLKDHKPPVKKMSQSVRDPKPMPERGIDARKAFAMYAVRDKLTGQIGAVLRILKSRYAKPDVAEVEGALNSGGLYGEGYIWIVVRGSGHWKVKRRKSTWIS